MLKLVALSSVKVGRLKTDPDHVKALAHSMVEVQMLEPLLVTEDLELIAGAHRFCAAKLAGLKQVPVHVLKLDEIGQRIVQLDENLLQLQRSALERADMLAERKRYYEAAHPETKPGKAPKGKNKKSKVATVATFSADAAKKTGKSARSIRQYVEVAEKIDPKAKKIIAKTSAANSIGDLQRLSKMTVERQLVIAGRVAKTDESVKKAARAVDRIGQEKKVAAYVAPDGKFNVVTVDFSWEYDDKLDGSDAVRGGLPYPAMKIEEIVEFIRGPLANCCDETCLLGSWITGPMSLDLRVAPVVQREIEALGFRPLHERVWKKTRATGGQFVGLGRPIRWDAEKLQLYVRGKVLFNELGEEHGRPIQQTVFEAPVGEHSEKPQRAYSDLEQLVPYTSRLEMFSRAPREGWVTSGAEMPDAAPAPVESATSGAAQVDGALVPPPAAGSASPDKGGALSERSDKAKARRAKNVKIAEEYRALSAPARLPQLQHVPEDPWEYQRAEGQRVEPEQQPTPPPVSPPPARKLKVDDLTGGDQAFTPPVDPESLKAVPDDQLDF